MPKKVTQERGASLAQRVDADLRGKQSVRATFKLTAGCIDAITVVATQLGIKQKSLFDHLSEDIDALAAIARQAQRIELKRLKRIQKTFVISRKSLLSLEQVARDYDAPRDALIEYSVQRLLPIILRERQRHENRKQLLSKIRHYFEKGKAIRDELNARLGADDPVCRRFEAALAAHANAYDHIVSVVEKGKAIEAFDPEELQQALSTD